MTIKNVLDGVWDYTPREDEAEFLAWCAEKLRSKKQLVFENESDARLWALENTDLTVHE